jgi:hypothetical protein
MIHPKIGTHDIHLLNIVKDAERFILRFFDAMEVSARHIYHSALPWAPASCLIRTQYQDQISSEVKLFNAIDHSWDAHIRTIKRIGFLSSIAFSHKDDLIAVCGDGRVEVFEVVTGHRRNTFAKIGSPGSSFLSCILPGRLTPRDWM